MYKLISGNHSCKQTIVWWFSFKTMANASLFKMYMNGYTNIIYIVNEAEPFNFFLIFYSCALYFYFDIFEERFFTKYNR